MDNPITIARKRLRELDLPIHEVTVADVYDPHYRREFSEEYCNGNMEVAIDELYCIIHGAHSVNYWYK